MAKITISIINDSTRPTDDEIKACIPAWQTQISNDFAPAWGIDALLTFVEKGVEPEAGTWWLSFLDDHAQAEALGRHDVTPDGLPHGKVFTRADLDNHLCWSVTASHELLEMLADPEINLTAFIQDSANSGKLYAYEICDAVEDDQYSYMIEDVAVSNFVLPLYYRPSAAVNGAKFDHQGKLGAPVPAQLSGGYLSEFTINGGGWTQNSTPTEGQPHRGHLRMNVPGGRADKRRRPRSQWRPSTKRLRPPPGKTPRVS